MQRKDPQKCADKYKNVSKHLKDFVSKFPENAHIYETFRVKLRACAKIAKIQTKLRNSRMYVCMYVCKLSDADLVLKKNVFLVSRKLQINCNYDCKYHEPVVIPCFGMTFLRISKSRYLKVISYLRSVLGRSNLANLANVQSTGRPSTRERLTQHRTQFA